MKLTAAFRNFESAPYNRLKPISTTKSLQKEQNASICITETFADLTVRANSPQMSPHLRSILTSNQ